ncbi:MAG: hypothetical protein ACOCXG_00035 [Nanoarchaeota archaeon]
MAKNNKKLTLIFSICFIFFVLGFALGWLYTTSDSFNYGIEIQQAELDLISFSQSLEFYSLINSSVCENGMLSELSRDLAALGRELVKLEESNDLDSQTYDFLKQKYNINQVTLYSLFYRYSQECESNQSVILFFFDESEESRKQGLELDKIVSEYDMKVFAMDYNYTSSLNYFYDFYDVEKLPFMVLNFNQTFEEFTEKKDLEVFLK